MPRPCGALCTRRVHATTASGKIGLPVNNRKNTGDFSTKRRATIQGAERAAELISAIRPFIRRFSSSDYSNALALGEVCLVVGWSGDIKQAQRQTLSSERVARIGYSIPDDRAQMWLDNLAIPKGAPHPEEAHAFIDFMLIPEMAAKNTNSTRNANGNLASQGLIAPEIMHDPTIYPLPEVMKKLYTVNTQIPRRSAFCSGCGPG